MKVILQDFSGPGIYKKKIQDFPRLSRRHQISDSGITDSGFYPSKSGIEIWRNFPPVLGSGSPQFLTQVFPSILGFFSLHGKKTVKGVDRKKGESKK